jgi:peptidoglycan/LPS O-acetylase OafA/YrhL
VKAKRYRADIDGLRAVAVLLVIAYHLWPGTVISGYIGVDIFFVISGYVVAQSSLGQLSGKPLVDMFFFWIRRIRRILPLLLLVVLVGALIVAILYPPFFQ